MARWDRAGLERMPKVVDTLDEVVAQPPFAPIDVLVSDQPVEAASWRGRGTASQASGPRL